MSKYLNDKQLDFLQWYIDNYQSSILIPMVRGVIEKRCVDPKCVKQLNGIRYRQVSKYIKSKNENINK
jgi:hypothetical protein